MCARYISPNVAIRMEEDMVSCGLKECRMLNAWRFIWITSSSKTRSSLLIFPDLPDQLDQPELKSCSQSSQKEGSKRKTLTKVDKKALYLE